MKELVVDGIRENCTSRQLNCFMKIYLFIYFSMDGQFNCDNSFLSLLNGLIGKSLKFLLEFWLMVT